LRNIFFLLFIFLYRWLFPQNIFRDTLKLIVELFNPLFKLCDNGRHFFKNEILIGAIKKFLGGKLILILEFESQSQIIIKLHPSDSSPK